MKKTIVWLIIVVVLVAGNVWQSIGANHRANTAISEEMMAFIPALDNAVSSYKRGNINEAAIQIGIAGGEMQAITAQLTETPRQNASFVAEYLRNNAIHVRNNDTQSKAVMNYIETVDTLFDASKSKAPYNPSQLPGQLQQIVKTMPST
ncbi:MAG: hypothetical protein K6T78_10555 [Alicyclobacillus sp.]|nr:hypothetical protein [Alicyclobacillus sp.]